MEAISSPGCGDSNSLLYTACHDIYTPTLGHGLGLGNGLGS